MNKKNKNEKNLEKVEDNRGTYLAWLRDAHAMETGLITVLEKQAKETEKQPEMHKRIKQHLEETKMHADLMEACLKRNGGDTSKTKDFISKSTAAVNGLGMSMMGDAMVKNVYSSYSAEHMEIASYTALGAAARAMGDSETASVCEKILKDEVDMANWLIKHLPTVVTEQLGADGSRRISSSMMIPSSVFK
jgi:ferritin-like metal-binding protein YciE